MKEGNKKVFLVGLVIVLFCLFAIQAYAQVFPGNYDPTFLLPITYFYTNPLYYTNYGYFNSINGYLLGYLPFTPFLGPVAAASYNALGIPTFPYVGSPYQTTFPYTTLPGTVIPYARFDYPTYVYGSPDFYLSWVLLQ